MRLVILSHQNIPSLTTLELFIPNFLPDYCKMSNDGPTPTLEGLPQEIHDHIGRHVPCSDLSNLVLTSQMCHHRYNEILYCTAHVKLTTYADQFFWKSMCKGNKRNVVKDIVVHGLPPSCEGSDQNPLEMSVHPTWNNYSIAAPHTDPSCGLQSDEKAPETCIHFTRTLIDQIAATPFFDLHQPPQQMVRFVSAMTKLPTPTRLCIDCSGVNSTYGHTPSRNIAFILKQLAHSWTGVKSFLTRGSIDVVTEAFRQAASVLVTDGNTLKPLSAGDEQGLGCACLRNLSAACCPTGTMAPCHPPTYQHDNREYFVTNVSNDELDALHSSLAHIWSTTMSMFPEFRHGEVEHCKKPKMLEEDTFCCLHD